jgi:hypothetical protein
MKRRLWTMTLALCGSTLLATAQAPNEVPSAIVPLPAKDMTQVAPAAKIGDLLTFRTSGQADRQVRILKIDGTLENDGIADVQDVTTGAKYTIPLKIVSGMVKSTAKPTTPTASPAQNPGLPSVTQTQPKAVPAGENGWPKTASTKPAPVLGTYLTGNGLGRPTDPKSTIPPVGTVRNLMRPETPAPPPPPVVREKPIYTAQPAATKPAPTPKPVVVVEGRSEMANLAMQAKDDVLFRPSSPVQVKPLTPATSLDLPPTQPAFSTVKAPAITVAPPQYTEVPVADFGPPPVTPLPEPTSPVLPSAAPSPVVEAPKLAPPVLAAQPVTPPTLAPVSIAPAAAIWKPIPEPLAVGIVPVGLYEQAPVQMVEEIQPFVNDLSNALRPSLRERAATGLAEGRYGSTPGVKATLARAALTDPAPSVRAHCISLLSKLGYHESSYLDFLATCADSGHAIVKQAAIDALAKLQRRG